MKMVDNYLLNPQTIVMAPGRQLEYETKVYEEDEIILVKQSMDSIIKESCIQVGFSTYKSRMEVARRLTDYDRKIPVIVSKALDICFFPTHSFTNIDNYSISSKHVFYIEQTKDKDISIVHFTNHMSLEIPCSSYIIKEQYERSRNLSKLSKRNHKR